MFQVNTLVGKTTNLVLFSSKDPSKGNTLRGSLYMPYGMPQDKVVNGEARKIRDNMFVPIVAFGANADKLHEVFGPVDKVASPRRVALIGEWQPTILQPSPTKPKIIKAKVNIDGKSVDINLDAAELAKTLAKDFYYTGWEFRVIYWRYADDMPEGTQISSGSGLVATISTGGSSVTEGGVEVDGAVGTTETLAGDTFSAGALDDVPF